MENLARLLLIVGVTCLAAGGLIFLLARAGWTLENFPGNLRYTVGNNTCVVALGLSLFLSVVLTIALNLVVRLLNR